MLMRPQLAKLKYNLNEVVEITGESKTNVEHAIRAGHLEVFVVGRRRCARPEAVKRWIDLLQRASDRGKPIRYQARDVADRP